MSGVVIVDKPEDVTSHDVVKRVRSIFKTRKVGHLGTLDPMATGVLPVCIGKATRMGPYFTNSPKEYIGEIRFGFSTTTYDRQGTPTSNEQRFEATQGDIEHAIREFTGEIDQVAPSFSAKKFGGIPAHRFARQGKAVEIAPVSVTVEEFAITRFEGPLLEFRVICSAGTYIRSLAHDLGQRFGCGAHLTVLRRTRAGDFVEANAIPLEILDRTHLIPLDQLLEAWPRIEVSGIEEDRVLHGNFIHSDVTARYARIFNKKGEFMAIASVENGLVSPKLVLTSITSD